VCDALTATGHLDDAYRLLLQRECPSWLYPVTMGGRHHDLGALGLMLPDGRINPGEMTSFNHYALGAVADWLHRVVGGIEPAEPGYRTVRIAPRPRWRPHLGGDFPRHLARADLRRLAAGRLRPA
jgi:alpha-L-rhamnosidase